MLKHLVGSYAEKVNTTYIKVYDDTFILTLRHSLLSQKRVLFWSTLNHTLANSSENYTKNASCVFARVGKIRLTSNVLKFVYHHVSV